MTTHLKKKSSLLILFLSIHFSISAQKGSQYLSLGPSVVIPLKFSPVYKTGIGAGLRGYFGIGTQGFILGNVNFISFPSKFRESNYTLTSAKFGIGSFLNTPNVFIYADGGLVFRRFNVGSKNAGPAAGIGIGFALPVRNGGYIDFVPSFNVDFSYEEYNPTWLDLHIAYRFRTKGR